jgi:hypothetical protein
MATVWKTTGDIGPGSQTDGTDFPLKLIDERLSQYKVYYLGPEPKRILPISPYFIHVVVQVNGLDNPTDRFGCEGFYRVFDLIVEDAGFLFKPA